MKRKRNSMPTIIQKALQVTSHIFHGGFIRKHLRLWQEILYIRGQINYGIRIRHVII